MPFDLSNPFEFSCFMTLHPDCRTETEFGKPDTTVGLNELVGSLVTYTTLTLAEGVELHHDPLGTGPASPVADALAAQYGFAEQSICGAVYLTGDSGESDTALGMDPDTFCDLHGAAKKSAEVLGLRLWRRVPADEQVSVRFDDLAQGDTYWCLGESHRFMGFKPFPAGSKTLEFIPDARILFCEDGFQITASPATYEERADRAPAGYWQRTGNQLLPASK
ncbi:hypothetical protein [Streptomyces sp. NPDC050485]|uniref:hypothetical protein n=1 Tax=Streptomyces sp. NPDC050485 TaxID=3365617 RepID=UPI0037926934